ncbi:MAG: CRISPR-associated endonuclease Cas1 [Peptococcaceae bacterium]|nr:MAG: CRISPR-associated endonuclease Cas1 [Peptococcaceae bacterium]
MHVIISEHGMFLGKKSERLVIKKAGETVSETPLFDVEQITIATSGVSISADLIHDCVERGIQINFLTYTGKPYAKVTSPTLSGTVATRREQLMAFYDERGIQLAKAIIEGKLRNQINVLKYFAKYRKEADKEVYACIYDATRKMESIKSELVEINGKCIDDVRGQLMSVEGRTSTHYWNLVGQVLLDKIEFPGREHRGATDAFNSLLNYGYGMLYSQAWGALILAGLEPFGGFLHVDRPGRASLVLDFVEEFRQQVVDRVVIAMISKGYTPRMEEDRLSAETRKEFSKRILERLDGQERYEAKKYRLKTIIQMQARHMATFLRREGKYKAFVGGW